MRQSPRTYAPTFCGVALPHGINKRWRLHTVRRTFTFDPKKINYLAAIAKERGDVEKDVESTIKDETRDNQQKLVAIRI